jgi:TolB-like protein/DNA-binding winged helix-turn-helix (wHTH) protein/Flp pilus assembly protein TadD
MSPPTLKRFGAFELDIETGELRRNGVKLKLQDKPFQMLAMLLERPGEIVTREALRERLWAADTFVDFDHGLNTATKKLRQVLGDSAENPRFIETLARRGYRFIAPLQSTKVLSQHRNDRTRLVALISAGVVLIGLGWGAWTFVFRDQQGGADPAPRRPVQLAVLPLKVVSTGETERHLGVGIADAVITRLANVRTLRVRPTAAVAKYDSETVDPRRAGEELDAEHVLSGTLRKAADRYRVSLQLIRTNDGVPIWGRTYDVARTDLLTIEDHVSQQVAAALQRQLTARSEGGRIPRLNPGAYEAYLQGRALLLNYSESNMRAAIDGFENAIRLQPEYALAHAGLATAFARFSRRYAYEKDAVEWGRRAEEQAYRALALDHELGEAHLAIAGAAGTTFGRFNWSRALAEADLALQFDPMLALAHTERARALYHLGLFKAAEAAAASALDLNPASNVETERLMIAMALFSGRFDDARKQAERLASRSDTPAIRMYLAQALFYLGHARQAAELLATIKRGSEPDVRSQAALASVLAAMGQRVAARATIDRIVSGPYMDHHIAYSLGAASAQLGRTDDALRFLRAAADDGFPCYAWFMADPLLAPIHQDASYRQLIDNLRVRFEEARARYDGDGGR